MPNSQVLRVISVAYGKSLEGGRQISYVLDGHEKTLNGELARMVEEKSLASEGLQNDLPAILAEVLQLISDEPSGVDAKWMTKEELAIHQQQQLPGRKIGQEISEV